MENLCLGKPGTSQFQWIRDHYPKIANITYANGTSITTSAAILGWSEVGKTNFSTDTTSPIVIANGGTTCMIVGNSTFYNCSALTTASFTHCTTISNYAFYNCSALTTVSFPICNTIRTYAFCNCSTLTTASFPTCKTIGNSAF